jgi:sulfite exporter TauE/SafE
MNFLIPAFILGLFGSLHCIGMCGPLVMSMPFQQVKNGQKWLANLNYHVGKTSTYAIMGLFVGILGKTFVLLEWQQILSILSGVFLLLITLLPMLKQKLQWTLPLQNGFAKIYQKMEVNPKPIPIFSLLGL